MDKIKNVRASDSFPYLKALFFKEGAVKDPNKDIFAHLTDYAKNTEFHDFLHDMLSTSPGDDDFVDDTSFAICGHSEGSGWALAAALFLLGYTRKLKEGEKVSDRDGPTPLPVVDKDRLFVITTGMLAFPAPHLALLETAVNLDNIQNYILGVQRINSVTKAPIDEKVRTVELATYICHVLRSTFFILNVSSTCQPSPRHFSCNPVIL